MMKKDSNLNQDYILRKKCVLCSSSKIKLVLNFNKTPLANSYPEKLEIKNKTYPLRVILCKSCGHLQLLDLVKPDIMFKNYLYVSGTSKVLINHFKNYSQKIIKKFKLKKNDKILDIACNDGTFLENFINKKFNHVIGVEPAKNLIKINKKKKIDINCLFFDYEKSFFLKKKYKSFKIITANNVCAHVPNLKSFFNGVKNILDKDGCFIFEVSYLMDVIKKLSFDTIYHEHMSYHSIKPLNIFFKKIGLEIFDFDFVKAQGGSIRFYVSHKNRFKVKKIKIKKQIKLEIKKGLFKNSLYNNYYKRILLAKKKLKKILEYFINKNYKIYGFGAPAKLTTFSYVFDIQKDHFVSIIDDNELKQKRFSPGKKIPIVSYRNLFIKKFDVILIFAWNFSGAIIKRLKKDFKYKNKKIILPFPKPKIIKC